MKHALTALVLACLLIACDSVSTPDKRRGTIRLEPLSTHSQVFSNDQGTFRIDYFFTDGTHPVDAAANKELRAQVEEIHAGIPPNWDIHSIYVYRRTERLNDRFTGNADDLRGVHDSDLICYCRWNRLGPDVFYLIENGNVVFDMLTNKPISPPGNSTEQEIRGKSCHQTSTQVRPPSICLIARPDSGISISCPRGVLREQRGLELTDQVLRNF